MDHLEKLRNRFENNATRISELRKEIERLEIDQHEISIAEKVMASLVVGQPSLPPASVMSPELFLVSPEAPTQDPVGKISTKKLILIELGKAPQLTKMDIVSRLYAAGHKVNSTTVGTMLSKMVGSEVEKAGPYAYRLKGETPGATGVSGATELGGSKS